MRYVIVTATAFFLTLTRQAHAEFNTLTLDIGNALMRQLSDLQNTTIICILIICSSRVAIAWLNPRKL